MTAKDFYRRYAAQMRREAEETLREDLKSSFLNLAQHSDWLAEHAGDEDQTIRL